MNATRQPARYVIAGAGVAAAMAALALASRLPPSSHSITVLCDGDGAGRNFGQIVATRPDVRRFHGDYAVNEDDLVRAGAASFTLGTAYSNWSASRPTYFLPYGDAGAAIGGVAFHLLAARLGAEGNKIALADYSVAAIMAQSGRFARPSDDPRSVLSTFTYGLHLDAGRYAEALFKLARERGATVVQDSLRSVETADGRIEALHLASGERLAGQIFVDATGTRAALASGLQGGEFERWEDLLPFDRVVSAVTRVGAPPAPYAHVAANSCGWRMTVPAGSVVGEVLVYSSDLLSPEHAERMLLAKGTGEPITAPHHAAVIPGSRRPWIGNCIAFGEAAVVAKPLHSVPMTLLQNGIERLLRLLPADREMEAEATEFNRAAALEAERARDLAILPYRLNGQRGEPLWDRLSEAPLSGELERKIGLYSSRGRVPLLDGDMLDEAEWAALFDGHGVIPERIDVLAKAIPLERLTAQLARMRQIMVQAIAPLPQHGDYLRQLSAKTVAA